MKKRFHTSRGNGKAARVYGIASCASSKSRQATLLGCCTAVQFRLACGAVAVNHNAGKNMRGLIYWRIAQSSPNSEMARQIGLFQNREIILNLHLRVY